MSTGKAFVEITHNRLAEVADLKDRWFDYLSDANIDTLARVFDDSGVFTPGLSFDISANDEFSIIGSSAATDGIGHLLQADNSLAAYCQNVSFENTLAVDYDVALHHVTGPMIVASGDAIRANSRTTQPEYVGRMEFIGEKGEPDNISLLGDDITFTIDSLCEAGVSHAGRKALVYLKVPSATTSAVGLPIVTVAWDSGENKITVLTDKLGQGTISTDLSDYEVIVLGPTVRRNTSLENKTGYAFIGKVTGGGSGSPPSAQDLSGQRAITSSLSDLNNAFEQFASSNSIVSGEAGRKDPKPTDCWGAACAVYNDQIYTFGGALNNQGTGPVNATEVYDPENDSWASKVSVPDSFSIFMSAATWGNYIYVVGGQSDTDYTDLTRRYDPVGDSWTTLSPLPQTRSGGSLIASNGFLYYIGGDGGTFGTVNPQVSVYRYDPVADSWIGLSDLPGAKVYHGSEVYDNKLYVFSGGDDFETISPETYVYNPSSDSWETLSVFETFQTDGAVNVAMNAPGAWSSHAIHNGVIHSLCGGGQQATIFSSHMVYEPDTDSWSRLPRPETHVIIGCAYGIVDGILYMFGGLGSKPGIVDDPDLTANSAFAVNLNNVHKAKTPGTVTDVGLVEKHSDVGVTNTLSNGLLSARVGSGSCRLGSGILVTGGYDGVSATMDSCELHFPQTGLRCLVRDMPSGRAFHAAISTSYGDNDDIYRVLVIGGASAVTYSPEVGFVQEESTWEWNPHTNTWRTVASFGNVSSSAFGHCVIDDIVYMFGGVGDGSNRIKGYHLQQKRYLGNLGSIPVSSIYGSAVYAYNGKVYSLGGRVGGVSGSETDAIYIFDPKMAGWGDGLPAISSTAFLHQEVDIPNPASMMDVDEWNGRFYYLDHHDNKLMEINPDTLLSTTIETGLSTRFSANVHVINGNAYMIGGSENLNWITCEDSIYEIRLPDRVKIEESLSPQNYSKGKKGDSVAFKTGDVYGQHSWDPYTSSEMIVMKSES